MTTKYLITVTHGDDWATYTTVGLPSLGDAAQVAAEYGWDEYGCDEYSYHVNEIYADGTISSDPTCAPQLHSSVSPTLKFCYDAFGNCR